MGALITQTQADIVEQVIIKGDLAQLTPAERVNYYRSVCDSIGLNPLTKPFEYINLKGKLTLYARKDAADQLRKINRISIGKPDITFEGDLIVVAVAARDPQGRQDSDIGVVKKSDMGGDVANALMKAVTKAKRRVTLSLCGLGWLDETEVETIPDAKPVIVLEDGKLGPNWPDEPRPQEQAGNGNGKAATELTTAEAVPEPTKKAEAVKSAALRHQPFVAWANTWVQNSGKDYARKDNSALADMWHLLKRVGMLGYREITAENADDIKATLESYVRGKVDAAQVEAA